MSRMSILGAVDRIRCPQRGLDSHLAVFALPDDDPGYVDVVFEQTVETRRRIDAGDERYIGTFNGTESRAAIRGTIFKHSQRYSHV